MSRPPNPNEKRKICPICNKEKIIKKDFYKSESPLYSEDGCVPICSLCVKKSVLNKDGTIDLTQLKKMCQRIDKPYYIDLIDSAVIQTKEKNSYLSDDEIAKRGDTIIGLYFKNLAMPAFKGKSYSDSEKNEWIVPGKSSYEKQKLKKRYADGDNIFSEKKTEAPVIEWSAQDIKNMEYAIDVVGYDPFEDYPEENRRFLFNSLAPYLEDEDTADDAYKLSQIIQIVDNNNQIRICNKRIANLDQLRDSEEIKTIQSIKKGLVESNDRIAKENEISVKNRSNKDAGKSTLTYLMRDLREKDFEKAEADYYDQLRSEGTQWAISISQKAMLEHCLFDENDKKEVYEMQLKLIQDLNIENDDLREEIRQLLKQIDSLNFEIEKLKK